VRAQTFDKLPTEDFFGTGQVNQFAYFDFAPMVEVKCSRSLMRLPFTPKQFVADAQRGDGVHRVFKVLDDNGAELPIDERDGFDLSLLSIRPSTDQQLALMQNRSDAYLRIKSAIGGEPYRDKATRNAVNGKLEVRCAVSTWLPEALDVTFPAHVIGDGAARRAQITLSAANLMVARLEYATGDRCPISGRQFGTDMPLAIEITTTETTASITTLVTRTIQGASSSSSSSASSSSSSSSSLSSTTTTTSATDRKTETTSNVLLACLTFIEWLPKRDKSTGKWKMNPGASAHVKYYCLHCRQWKANNGTLLPRKIRKEHQVPETAALLVESFAPYEPTSILALPLENATYFNGLSPDIDVPASSPLEQRRCTAEYLRRRFRSNAIEWCRIGTVPLSVQEQERVKVQFVAPQSARYLSEAFKLDDKLLMRDERCGEHVVGILDAQCGKSIVWFFFGVLVTSISSLQALARASLSSRQC
jgi:hypothetical protein